MLRSFARRQIGRSLVVPFNGQLNRELCFSTVCGTAIDAPMMLIRHNLIGRMQTQPRRLGTTTSFEEGIEEIWEMGVRNSRAIVANANLNRVVCN